MKKNVFALKKLVALSVFILFCIPLFSLSACAGEDNSQFLRVHIRANSNAVADQDIKYAVKQALTAYLTPELAKYATDKESACCVVNERLREIVSVSEKVLQNQGMPYGARAEIRRELFPLRSYGEFTFEEGMYDALIVTLGEGKGDNWWCMVYPPLCFVGGEDDGSGHITYKSILAELIEKFRQSFN